MMFPTVHLNGTSQDALLEQLASAVNAVSTAIRVVGEAAPNARDYYPQGPQAYHSAVAEHSLRVGKLNDVYADLSETYNNVADQVNNRRRGRL